MRFQDLYQRLKRAPHWQLSLLRLMKLNYLFFTENINSFVINLLCLSDVLILSEDTFLLKVKGS